MKIIRFFAMAALALSPLFLNPAAAHSDDSPVDRGGDLVKGGGGCREIFLRMDLDAFASNARAQLADLHLQTIKQAIKEEHEALEALVAQTSADHIEAKFDEDLFESCRSLGGAHRGGLCLSIDLSDATVYVSTQKLYEDEVSGAESRPKMTEILAELYLRRAGVSKNLWPHLARRLQLRSESSLVRHRDPEKGTEVSYHPDHVGSTEEIHVMFEGEHVLASRLIQNPDRNPCLMQGASQLVKWSFSHMGWEDAHNAFSARGVFHCRDNTKVSGTVVFKFKSGSPVRVLLRGLGPHP